MSVENELRERSGSLCEMCGEKEGLSVYTLPPKTAGLASESVLVCDKCLEQIEDPTKMDASHWRCLNDSIWNEATPVKVLSWRMLQRLTAESWSADLLDMLYLDEEALEWANHTDGISDAQIIHLDTNGAPLHSGDTVILIKELDVKGASFTAKRGTAVRNIRLVQDNAEQIEGRVNGQLLVLLTKFVKKSS